MSRAALLFAVVSILVHVHSWFNTCYEDKGPYRVLKHALLSAVGTRVALPSNRTGGTGDTTDATAGMGTGFLQTVKLMDTVLDVLECNYNRNSSHVENDIDRLKMDKLPHERYNLVTELTARHVDPSIVTQVLGML